MVQIMYVERNNWERTCMGHKWSEGVLETGPFCFEGACSPSQSYCWYFCSRWYL